MKKREIFVKRLVSGGRGLFITSWLAAKFWQCRGIFPVKDPE